MTGSNKKNGSDDAGTTKDAPPLPTDSDSPGSESLPKDQDIVASQAQPMDEQESPTTTLAGDEEDGVYLVKLAMDNVPRADQYEVKEGQHDPSLVMIPGLGQFQNGTTTKISETQMVLFTGHLSATGLSEVSLPAGVTIEKEGK